MASSEQPDLQRHVGPVLATAIIASPLLFYWLLLRRGYARSTRKAALVYLIGNTTLGLLAAIFGATP